MDFRILKYRLSSSQLFKDSLWALIGSVLGKGLSLVAGIIVARFLGKDIYGEYGMIKNTLFQIAIFSTLGLGYTGTTYIAKAVKDNAELIVQYVKIIYHITIAVSFTLALFTFIFADSISTYIEAPETAPAFRLTSLIIFFNGVNTAQIGILSGFQKFKTIAINNTWGGVSTFILSTILTIMYNLKGALFALLISMMINALLNTWSIRKEIKKNNYPLHTDIPRYLYLDLISFSIPVALQESLYSVVWWAMSLLLIKMSNYGELGLYSAAGQWASIVLFMPGVLKNVILSHFSYSENHELLRRRMLFVNFSATFIPFFFICILSQWITNFYGQSYSALPIVLIINCATSIFASISSVIFYEYISMKKTWLVFYVRLCRDVLILSVSFSLLSFSKITGAIAISISSLTISIICALYLLISIKKYK